MSRSYVLGSNLCPLGLFINFPDNINLVHPPLTVSWTKQISYPFRVNVVDSYVKYPVQEITQRLAKLYTSYTT